MRWGWIFVTRKTKLICTVTLSILDAVELVDIEAAAAVVVVALVVAIVIIIILEDQEQIICNNTEHTVCYSFTRYKRKSCCFDICCVIFYFNKIILFKCDNLEHVNKK